MPEKLLYQLYLSAIKQFSVITTRYVESKPKSIEYYRTASLLTQVILLVNPAHQTALNFRRFSLLEPSQLGAHTTTPPLISYQAELDYISALFSIKTCAKNSALWHYRRVLLYYQHGPHYMSPDSKKLQHTKSGLEDDEIMERIDIPDDCFRHEFEIATRACEVYPRNYYAWFHRSLCLRSYWIRSHKGARAQLQAPHAEEIVGPEVTNLSLILEEFDFILRWIDRHVSDYSAVDYAFRIYDITQLACEKDRNDPCSVSCACASISSYSLNVLDKLVYHAWSLLQSFPNYENLWLYTRRALDISLEKAQLKEEIFDFATKIVGASSVLKNTTTEMENIKLGENLYTSLEFDTITRNALHFLLWYDRRVCPSSFPIFRN